MQKLGMLVTPHSPCRASRGLIVARGYRLRTGNMSRELRDFIVAQFLQEENSVDLNHGRGF